MEHQDPLIRWAIENAKNLNLLITQLNWADRLELDIHSFSCEITIDSVTTKGFGKDRIQEVAIKKSIIEAIERYLIGEFNLKTSNGVAGHTDLNLAEKNAVNELIERDLFFCHFLTKTPFKRISDDLYIENFRTLFAWSHRAKINFSLYYLGTTGCLGLIDGRLADEPFGYFVTTTFSDSLDKSIDNTLLNLTQRGFYYYQYKKRIQNISLHDFVNIKSPSFDHHGLLALNIEYANSIAFLFDGDSGVIGKPLERNLITCSPLVSSAQVLKNVPASFARAESRCSQNLFLGLPSEKLVNFDRLSEFSNIKQSMQTILNLPHPMD